MILQPTLTVVPLSHVFQFSNIDARVHSLAIKKLAIFFPVRKGAPVDKLAVKCDFKLICDGPLIRYNACPARPEAHLGPTHVRLPPRSLSGSRKVRRKGPAALAGPL